MEKNLGYYQSYTTFMDTNIGLIKNNFNIEKYNNNINNFDVIRDNCQYIKDILYLIIVHHLSDDEIIYLYR
jgi:hypothetical protein